MPKKRRSDTEARATGEDRADSPWVLGTTSTRLRRASTETCFGLGIREGREGYAGGSNCHTRRDAGNSMIWFTRACDLPSRPLDVKRCRRRIFFGFLEGRIRRSAATVTIDWRLAAQASRRRAAIGQSKISYTPSEGRFGGESFPRSNLLWAAWSSEITATLLTQFLSPTRNRYSL